MQLVKSYRASKILYNFLKSNPTSGKYILPPNVCPVIPLTFREANVDFDFVDIDRDTLCIDLNNILDKIKDYAGVVYVRTYGVYEEVEQQFAKFKQLNPDFKIVDDSCLCEPIIQSSIESNADLILYSLGSKKQVDLSIGAFAYVSSLCLYSDFPIQQSLDDFEEAVNYHYLNHSLLTEKIHFLNDEPFKFSNDEVAQRLMQIRKHKSRINEIYKQELPKFIQLPEKFQQWRFNILVDNKSEVLNAIFDSELFASNHYKSLSYIFNKTECPNAEELHERVINLFNDSYYTEEQAFRTCDVIKRTIL